MRCPLCGSELEIIPPPDPPKIDWWRLSDDAIIRAIENEDRIMSCRRSECICPKGCFKKDFPLYYHHPDSIDRAPGDTWSLSWVK